MQLSTIYDLSIGANVRINPHVSASFSNFGFANILTGDFNETQGVNREALVKFSSRASESPSVGGNKNRGSAARLRKSIRNFCITSIEGKSKVGDASQSGNVREFNRQIRGGFADGGRKRARVKVDAR